MTKNISLIGFIGGILIAVLVGTLPLTGIPPEGQKCLAISLMAVVWWATKVVHPGYTSMTLLVGYVLLGVAPANVVFRLWTTPIIYMIIGAYLIAAAVHESGLGKRIAYLYIIKYVNSYRSIIIGMYVLGFLLSFLIPHPWPRSFLIMSVVAIIVKSAKIPVKDAVNIGLAVFAGSVPTSMILLTGDATVNPVAIEMSGQTVSWLGWLWYMGVPGVVATLLTLALQLVMYKPTAEVNINKEEIRGLLKDLGPVSGMELRCMIWIGLAILLWATDGIHKIHCGWVAIVMAMGLALPKVGGVLKPSSWKDVPIETAFFLTAALAIGTVGGHTGMNKWIADVLLPTNAPANPFMFGLFVTAIAVVIHMCLGSVMAVMGIAIPTLIQFGNSAGMNPLVPSLLVYGAIFIHYVLPFHHMNILVGLGEKQGGYSDKDVIRFGIPLTAIVFIMPMAITIPWWKIIGLL
ncbi:SLC13 family permease [Desulfolutivibrio sulfoxidireducens]|uniref:SLC13 family permease n=1 Tax=Desulfolutivibrio sulfoxidireducens TaxID=2773299 RepID=UPI00159D2053|nr:SLC13 family permease [Desulfolutivibrio sulfoxidireducens]QLA19774.1 SLC13 family permease [Desulfolutivibrio sulfoxidireducens]